MRRVYCVFFIKKCASRPALKTYIGLVLALGILSSVSVKSVFNNLLQKGLDFGSLSYFSRYAFMNTEFFVQTLLVLSVLFLFYLFFGLKKSGHISFFNFFFHRS